MRTLCLAHRRELIDQTAMTLDRFISGGAVGVYAASLNQRDTNKPITCAQIQSVYNKGSQFGSIDFVLIDEAHLVSERDSSMYQTLLDSLRLANPRVKLVGLSATPYRMDDGQLCGKDRTFTDICYEANVGDLIAWVPFSSIMLIILG